jgi:hypothetical protein
MTPVTKLFIPLFISAALLASCGNKIDKLLDQEEKALEQYEAKVKDGKATKQWIIDLQHAVSLEDFKNEGIDPKDITIEQQLRARDLQQRLMTVILNSSFENDLYK